MKYTAQVYEFLNIPQEPAHDSYGPNADMEIPEPGIDQGNNEDMEDNVIVENRERDQAFMTSAWWRSLSDTIVQNGFDQNGDPIEDDVVGLLNDTRWWRIWKDLYDMVRTKLHFKIPKAVREKQQGSNLQRIERLAHFLATKYGHDGAYILNDEA